MLEKIFDTFTIGNCQINNPEDIPIVNVIKITNENYGKYDMLCISQYGTIDVLPVLLSFNSINDAVEIPLGFVLKFPDMDYLNDSIEETTIFEGDVIPGICSSMNSQVVNAELTKELNIKSKKTTALPKISITLPAVKVDEASGTITF